MKILDTFAGAGGFSLGFEMAGCKIVGAIETDTWACETFQFNHPKATVIKGNIEDFSDEKLINLFLGNEPDIILGGPPCQGFSICNKNNGDPKDPRNSLFEEFVRTGRLFKPKVMIMENVPNLMKAKTKSNELVIDIIKNELRRLGYFVYSTILESIDYGVPQIRKRLFVVASTQELNNPFPKPTHSSSQSDLFNLSLKKTPTLWEAISDLPEIEAREGAEEMEYTSEPQNEFQRLLRRESKRLYNHLAMKHSKRMVERFSSMKWGQSCSDVPDHLKPYKRNSNGIVSDKIYDQNNRRMHPNKPCHTIPASFYANFVHPYKNRNFTAREGARIQAFPDTYIFKGKPTVVSHKLLAREGRFDEKYLCQYNQIGNAVPPLLAKALAENILNQLVEGTEECLCMATI
jgi:DNA (cytosine-5)-methyltransferase 1